MTPAFDRRSRVWVAGHTGLVGSALVRKLRADGFSNLLLPDRKEVDLCDQRQTRGWVMDHRPEFAFVAAAKVGGIQANWDRPADFLYENLMISANVMSACAEAGTAKLLYLASSCVYPRMAPQPIPEDALLTGPLEPTNEPYAIAKIAGLKLAQAYRRQHGKNFIAAMPTNLYGPGDNFDLETSHVLPALMRKFHEARPDGTVTIWGSGSPRREFLHVDDLSDALVFLMKNWDEPMHVNVGAGEDIAIADLAAMVRDVVAPGARVSFDASKPDGAPRKLLDVSVLARLGWRPRIPLREGIASTYAWFKEQAGRTRS